MSHEGIAICRTPLPAYPRAATVALIIGVPVGQLGSGLELQLHLSPCMHDLAD